MSSVMEYDRWPYRVEETEAPLESRNYNIYMNWTGALQKPKPF